MSQIQTAETPQESNALPPFPAITGATSTGDSAMEQPSHDCEPYRNQKEMQQELLRISSSLQRELSTAWSVANKVTQTIQRK